MEQGNRSQIEGDKRAEGDEPDKKKNKEGHPKVALWGNWMGLVHAAYFLQLLW